jgi:two-component system NtrC family sensor kinase
MAREAEDAQRQVARADKLASLGQLVAGVTHELNNPLTSVLTYAHLLRNKIHDKEFKRQLELIIEGGERCRQIVWSLLDFARERAPTKAPANVNSIVEHVIEMIQNQTLINKIGTQKLLQPNLPQINVDHHQIEQVLVNICMNAIEAMPQGGSLSIKSDFDQETGLIKIIIKDTGPGIPKENMEKIFDPFFTTKAPGAGTGLGLAISHRIIYDHDGQIRVESEEGKGTQFTIELPVKYQAEGLQLRGNS